MSDKEEKAEEAAESESPEEEDFQSAMKRGMGEMGMMEG